MIYKTFKTTEEKEIREFTEKHKSRIGKDSMFFDPKGSVIIFMFQEDFDPKFTQTIIQRQVWQEQHQKICRELADIEAKLILWNQLPHDAKVGEKDLSGVVGGMRGVEVITAKKGIEILTVDKANYEKQLEVLEQLLSK